MLQVLTSRNYHLVSLTYFYDHEIEVDSAP